MELASALSSALGFQLPATLAFDYPSVDAMAQHIHALLAPAQQASAVVSAALTVTGSPTAPAAQGSALISLAATSRLPTEALLGGPDCVGLVPFSRWDLEALQVCGSRSVAFAHAPLLSWQPESRACPILSSTDLTNHSSPTPLTAD